MKTQKTWVKVSLTNLEKSNLENHARLNKLTDQQMINLLIVSLNDQPLNNTGSLEEGETKTSFNIDNNLVDILESFSSKVKVSKNQILRHLISNLPIIENQIKEDNNAAEISTRIDLDSKAELKDLVNKNSTNISTLVRQVFNKIDLVSVRDREYELDSKIGINVSIEFKKAFSKKSKELKISNSNLLRNIIYSILSK